MSVRVEHGDSRDILATLGDCSIDACVTDPPYGLEFMGREWDAPWQVSSKSALFGKRKTEMPGWGVTRNPTCRSCGGRLRGAKRCGCATPAWDEAPNATRLRQMQGFQDWCQEWAEQVYRVLKPGAHLVAFGGTRTYHRLACAIEDAGFEVRDQLAWTFGSGFPKSHNVAVALDKAAGVAARGKAFNMKGRGDRADELDANGREFPPPYSAITEAARQWDGWGTALKPAWEPICLARKPLSGTVAQTVLQHGTGALNIDGCRVEFAGAADAAESKTKNAHGDFETGPRKNNIYGSDPRNRGNYDPPGRWPANLCHDGSDEVMAAFAEFGERSAAYPGRQDLADAYAGAEVPLNGVVNFGGNRAGRSRSDTGSAARFFFSAKAGEDDRADSKHPTVKPVALMRWLARLVTPPGGLVLDPFAGSGTTGVACIREGFDALLIEREADYHKDILHRIAKLSGLDAPLFAGVAG